MMDTQTTHTGTSKVYEPEAYKGDVLPSAIDPEYGVLGEGQTYETITEKVSSIALNFNGKSKGWLLGFAISFTCLMVLVVTIIYLVFTGTGIWGVNVPVGWGFAIINFVWWIGIGHAGTLISAILLLVRQDWRSSINRFAEAMTLFAVACAGIFPLLHVGRPWLAYWMLPYPNTMGVWPQFRSPLLWDVFAVSTYLTVSLVFWYIGLVPDMATFRDRAKKKAAKVIYGVLSLGWRGSAIHWKRYTTAYLLLAGLSAPLVLSVHTIVSFDFAVSVIPGWHATIFPPYFVAGAVYAGFAMVLTVVIPLRKVYNLYELITPRHINNMAKVMLATGLIVVYGYAMEAFFGWYSASDYEGFMIWNRMTGPYAFQYWLLIFCNGVVPQLLWFRKFRTNTVVLWIISLVVGVGMWLERFVIVVTSLHRDFMPSSWDMFHPTIWDWSMYLGTFGLFFTLVFLFVRFLPAINIFEMRELFHHQLHKKKGHH